MTRVSIKSNGDQARLAKMLRSSAVGAFERGSRRREQFHEFFLDLSSSLASLSGVSLDARHRCLANPLMVI